MNVIEMNPSVIGKKIDVLNYGHVVLEDYMGGDLSIANNARVSFNQDSDTVGDRERGLINFLMKNRHGSPFEAPTFRFDVKLPIFGIREWMRHRAGHSYNEQSARYSKIECEGYIPHRSDIREQIGKPGAYSFIEVEDDERASYYLEHIENAYRMAFNTYEDLLNEGFAKEISRIVLPVGIFTRMKWTTNLRAIMKFLELRNSEQAQREIRYYAQVVEDLVSEVCPIAMKSFIENGRVCP